MITSMPAMITETADMDICVGCGNPLWPDDRICEVCQTSIFEPWYVDDPLVALTRCSVCQAVLSVGEDRCDWCNTRLDDDYWDEFAERYGTDLIHADWARMFCCHSIYLGCCACTHPVHPALFGLLSSEEDPFEVYDPNGRCDDCRFQFTSDCPPLTQMVQLAADHLDADRGLGGWMPYRIPTCQHFETQPSILDKQPIE